MDVDVKSLRRRVELSGDLDELRSGLLTAIDGLEDYGAEEALNDLDWEIG